MRVSGWGETALQVEDAAIAMTLRSATVKLIECTCNRMGEGERWAMRERSHWI